MVYLKDLKKFFLTISLISLFLFLNNNIFQETRIVTKTDKVSKLYKIIQISDTHEKYMSECFYYLIKNEKPDLIVHTGDFTNDEISDNTLNLFKNLAILHQF